MGGKSCWNDVQSQFRHILLLCQALILPLGLFTRYIPHCLYQFYILPDIHIAGIFDLGTGGNFCEIATKIQITTGHM